MASVKAAAWSAATRLTVQPPKPPPVRRAPKQPGCVGGQVDEDVDLRAGGLEVVAEADMGFVHELAEAAEVGVVEGFYGGEDAVVFGDDVAAAAEDVGRHLMAPLGEVFGGGIAERLDLGAMRAKDFCSLFNFRAAGCCTRRRRRSV